MSGWWPTVIHVLGLSHLPSDPHSHPVTIVSKHLFAPLPFWGFIRKLTRENKLQLKHTLHWKRGLWTNTRASQVKLFQEDRDPESIFLLFSSVANTWLKRDGLEQQYFHWFCVHPGFSIPFESSRFLEQQHFPSFSVHLGFSLHFENSRFLEQQPKSEFSSRAKTTTYNWKPPFVWLEETLQDLSTGTHFLFYCSYEPSPQSKMPESFSYFNQCIASVLEPLARDPEMVIWAENV